MKQDQAGVDLQKLLPDLPGVPAIQVQGLTRDSRKVLPGYAYVALKGFSVDGHDFVAQAIEQGATAILCEREIASINNVVSIVVPNLAQQLGVIASRFFAAPSEKMQVIGVTGTNGKTSCTQFIAQALQRFNKSCGVVGTLGSGFLPQLNASGLTTPDAIGVQQTLAMLRDQGAEYIAMEVSSHGLDQKRVSGVDFNIAVFTNLSRDHLDYHQNMQAYADAKRQLFHMPSLSTAIINADDEFGRELLREVNVPNVFAYGLSKPEIENCQHIYVTKYNTNVRGLTAHVVSPWGEGSLKSKLLGDFNLSNLLAVLTVLCQLGCEFEQVLAAINAVETVAGRMQYFGGNKLPTVVVDYAHTPDALQHALMALRKHCHGKIWCVFGCGGDRDQGKRKLMGEVAERFSDQLVITNDNPRSEDPQEIVDGIMQGLLCPWAAEVELDRGTAIAHAIDCAAAEDMVLIAGKGHEPYQLVGNERIPFNDIEQVKQHISRKRIQRNQESRDDTVS